MGSARNVFDIYDSLLRNHDRIRVQGLGHCVQDSLNTQTCLLEGVLDTWNVQRTTVKGRSHEIKKPNFPDPGVEAASLASPALAGRFPTSSATWECLLKRTLINTEAAKELSVFFLLSFPVFCSISTTQKCSELFSKIRHSSYKH